MRRLNSVDALWLAADDDRQPLHVSMLTISEASAADGTQVDLAAVREILEQRMHLMPIFRWRLKQVPLNLDYPVFVDDPDFDIDSHLWEMASPPRATTTSSASWWAAWPRAPWTRPGASGRCTSSTASRTTAQRC
jgi:diacylglycerol O-acyltransferase / wax synthase